MSTLRDALSRHSIEVFKETRMPYLRIMKQASSAVGATATSVTLIGHARTIRLMQRMEASRKVQNAINNLRGATPPPSFNQLGRHVLNNEEEQDGEEPPRAPPPPPQMNPRNNLQLGRGTLPALPTVIPNVTLTPEEQVERYGIPMSALSRKTKSSITDFER
jgi:hypothetical protein